MHVGQGQSIGGSAPCNGGTGVGKALYCMRTGESSACINFNFPPSYFRAHRAGLDVNSIAIVQCWYTNMLVILLLADVTECSMDKPVAVNDSIGHKGLHVTARIHSGRSFLRGKATKRKV